MHRMTDINMAMLDQAIIGLKKGYNAEDWRVFSQAIDNLKDIAEIDMHRKQHGFDYHHVDSVGYAKSEPEGMHGLSAAYKEYTDAKHKYRASKTEENKAVMLMKLKKALEIHGVHAKELISCTDCEEEREFIMKMMKKHD